MSKRRERALRYWAAVESAPGSPPLRDTGAARPSFVAGPHNALPVFVGADPAAASQAPSANELAAAAARINARVAAIRREAEPPLDPVEAPFLAAIAADPSEAPRLIFADWLEERGDRRAAVIRADAAFSRETSPADREGIYQFASVEAALAGRPIASPSWELLAPCLSLVAWSRDLAGVFSVACLDWFERLETVERYAPATSIDRHTLERPTPAGFPELERHAIAARLSRRVGNVNGRPFMGYRPGEALLVGAHLTARRGELRAVAFREGWDRWDPASAFRLIRFMRDEFARRLAERVEVERAFLDGD